MKNRILNDAAALAAGNLITLVTGMVNTKIVAEFFTPIEFGLQAEVTMIATIIVTFFTLGLNHSPHYFIQKANSTIEKQNFISQLYLIYFILGIVAATFNTLFFSQIVHYFNDVNLYKCAVIVIFLPLVRLFNSAYSGIMVAQGRAQMSVVFNIIKVCATLIALIVVVILNFSIVEFLYFTFFIELLLVIFTTIMSFNITGSLPKLSLNKPLINKMLKFSVPLGLASMVSVLSIESDKLFVAYYLNSKELAIYTNMTKELPIHLMSAAFTTVLMPRIVKLIDLGKDKEAVKIWGYVTEISFVIVCFIVSGLSVFSREAIKILYSNQYVSGYKIFLIYLTIALFNMTQYSMIINAKGKTRLILMSSITFLVLDVISNFIGYHYIGMTGLAISSAATSYGMNLFLLFLTSRITRIPFKNIFPWENLFIILGKNLILTVIFMFTYKIIGIYESNHWFILTCACAFIWLGIYFFLMRKRWNKLMHNVKNIEFDKN